jgi:hypothetical protein
MLMVDTQGKQTSEIFSGAYSRHKMREMRSQYDLGARSLKLSRTCHYSILISLLRQVTRLWAMETMRHRTMSEATHLRTVRATSPGTMSEAPRLGTMSEAPRLGTMSEAPRLRAMEATHLRTVREATHLSARKETRGRYLQYRRSQLNGQGRCLPWWKWDGPWIILPGSLMLSGPHEPDHGPRADNTDGKSPLGPAAASGPRRLGKLTLSIIATTISGFRAYLVNAHG